MYAAREGHVTVVEALIEAGADIDIKLGVSLTPSYTFNFLRPPPLLPAYSYVSGNNVLNRMTPPSPLKYTGMESGYTALIWATVRGHVAVVQALLAAGANVDVKGGVSVGSSRVPGPS